MTFGFFPSAGTLEIILIVFRCHDLHRFRFAVLFEFGSLRNGRNGIITGFFRLPLTIVYTGCIRFHELSDLFAAFADDFDIHRNAVQQTLILQNAVRILDSRFDFQRLAGRCRCGYFLLQINAVVVHLRDNAVIIISLI